MLTLTIVIAAGNAKYYRYFLCVDGLMTRGAVNEEISEEIESRVRFSFGLFLDKAILIVVPS